MHFMSPVRTARCNDLYCSSEYFFLAFLIAALYDLFSVQYLASGTGSLVLLYPLSANFASRFIVLHFLLNHLGLLETLLEVGLENGLPIS